MESDNKPLFKSDIFMQVKVNVIEGIELRATDINMKCDPYVILKVEGLEEEYTTKTIEKNRNPKWNESFTFDVPEDVFETAKLVLTCFDKDDGKDDLIGEGNLELKTLKVGEAFNTEVPIAVKSKIATIKGGSIKLEILISKKEEEPEHVEEPKNEEEEVKEEKPQENEEEPEKAEEEEKPEEEEKLENIEDDQKLEEEEKQEEKSENDDDEQKPEEEEKHEEQPENDEDEQKPEEEEKQEEQIHEEEEEEIHEEEETIYEKENEKKDKKTKPQQTEEQRIEKLKERIELHRQRLLALEKGENPQPIKTKSAYNVPPSPKKQNPVQEKTPKKAGGKKKDAKNKKEEKIEEEEVNEEEINERNRKAEQRFEEEINEIRAKVEMTYKSVISKYKTITQNRKQIEMKKTQKEEEENENLKSMSIDKLKSTYLRLKKNLKNLDEEISQLKNKLNE